VLVSYDSLVTPPQSIRVDMSDPTSPRTVLKQTHVPGYVKEDYGCERTMVKSRDGTTEIPVSIVYRKNVMEEFRASHKPMPVHLNGYGSYGCCEEADFGVTRLPLLERGMVYVIAHVRGGGEMGRQWYEEPMGAKYLCKKNTFNDFVDVARWLVDEKKMTTSALLSCEGRSAGGLLIGASINQAPDLFKVAILGVPFVDVVPTMIDASIPLTIVEWEEWGTIIYF
jgi:oligopeptidase B